MSQAESTQECRNDSTTEQVTESLGKKAASDTEAPRMQPWLAVSLLAIVPMLVAFVLPKEHVLYTAAISGILLIAGVGMLVAQERKRG